MSDRILVSGEPVPADHSHTELKSNGQQRDYVVLTPEERAKGFVKPVRRTYVHKCGAATTMGLAIAETYARNPRFYSGTFCVGCGAHFPLIEFHWDDNEPMEPNLQEEWQKTNAEQKAREAKQWRERRIAELKRELAQLEQEGP
jgi:hypothetical protein